MEFMAYGLLYAAVTNPKQLPMELRGVPCRAWQHPYMKHALRVTSSAISTSLAIQKPYPPISRMRVDCNVQHLMPGSQSGYRPHAGRWRTVPLKLIWNKQAKQRLCCMNTDAVPQLSDTMQHHGVNAAAQVCLACVRSDACELLELYASAPRMTPYLMDALLERLRGRLAAALSAYSPSVPLSLVAAALGFDTLRQVKGVSLTAELATGHNETGAPLLQGS